MFRWGLVQDIAALCLCWRKGSFRSFTKNAATTLPASSDALVTDSAKRILLFSQPG